MYRHEKLPKLTRDAPGRYLGVYRDVELVVTKEADDRGRALWFARGGGIACGGRFTRDEAVRDFCDRVVEAALNLPELDRLLARWAAEVKAVAQLVSLHDVRAVDLLENLSMNLKWFDGSARMHAVRFERDLAQLRAYVAASDAKLIDTMPAGDGAGTSGGEQ